MEKTTLTTKDLEALETMYIRFNDDVMVSIARSFERLEERIDAMEARLNARLSDELAEVSRTIRQN